MNLPTIVLKRHVHRNQECLFFYFHYNLELVNHLRNFPGRKFSKTNGAWYVENHSNTIQRLNKYFQGIALVEMEKTKVSDRQKTSSSQLPELNNSQLNMVEQLKKYMRVRRYSASSINSYTTGLAVFLRFTGKQTPSEVSNQDIEDFNDQYIIRNNRSASYQNIVINAIRLFIHVFSDGNIDFSLLERPRSAYRLPVILSKSEVEKMLKSTTNLKHKCMLTLIYSCGLRSGELINMQVSDIDSERMVIHIRNAKGSKDRYVPLSQKLLPHLRDYYIEYRPKRFLFNSGDGEGKYSKTSLRKVFHRAVKRAGISKNVRLHNLRHSYATHLLEKGVNLRYIQELLGHNSPKTTQIYTLVTSEDSRKVISPLDDLEI